MCEELLTRILHVQDEIRKTGCQDECLLPRLNLTPGVNFSPFSFTFVQRCPFCPRRSSTYFLRAQSPVHIARHDTRAVYQMYKREKKDGIYYARVWGLWNGRRRHKFCSWFFGEKERGHNAKNGFLCVHICCYKLMPNRQRYIFQREQRNEIFRLETDRTTPAKNIPPYAKNGFIGRMLIPTVYSLCPMTFFRGNGSECLVTICEAGSRFYLFRPKEEEGGKRFFIHPPSFFAP